MYNVDVVLLWSFSDLARAAMKLIALTSMVFILKVTLYLDQVSGSKCPKQIGESKKAIMLSVMQHTFHFD